MSKKGKSEPSNQYAALGLKPTDKDSALRIIKGDVIPTYADGSYFSVFERMLTPKIEEFDTSKLDPQGRFNAVLKANQVGMSEFVKYLSSSHIHTIPEIASDIHANRKTLEDALQDFYQKNPKITPGQRSGSIKGAQVQIDGLVRQFVENFGELEEEGGDLEYQFSTLLDAIYPLTDMKVSQGNKKLLTHVAGSLAYAPDLKRVLLTADLGLVECIHTMANVYAKLHEGDPFANNSHTGCLKVIVQDHSGFYETTSARMKGLERTWEKDGEKIIQTALDAQKKLDLLRVEEYRKSQNL